MVENASEMLSGAAPITFQVKKVRFMQTARDTYNQLEYAKKKVESMESDVFDKEKEWDARFKDETNN